VIVNAAGISGNTMAYYKLLSNFDDETGDYNGIALNTVTLNSTGGVIAGRGTFSVADNGCIKTGLSGVY